MKYVTKLAVVLSFAVAAPAFGAGKGTEFLNIVNPLTIKKSFDDKHYGYTAAKAGVITAAVAAVGTGLWALNKYVPAFNKHVTQNVKAAAKGYVTRMRNVDVPTWMLTAAVLGLAASGVKIYRDHNALATKDADLLAANGRSVRANLERLAAVEFAAKKGIDLPGLEKAVNDTKAALAANADATQKARLEGAVTAAEEALATAKATHAGAFVAGLDNPAKAAEVTRFNAALDAAILQTLQNEDAIRAFKA